jgi:UPF0176 protein
LDQAGMDAMVNQSKSQKKHILGISSYWFAELDHLQDHRQLLAEIGQLLAVQGTILLSPEGINIAISGDRSSTEQMFEACKAIPGLEKLQPKKYWSNESSFSNLIVQIKDEIIKMDQPQIRPSKGRAPCVNSTTLQKWLEIGNDDLGKPIQILDTRNEFEIEIGSFENSINFKISKFSDFPEMFKKHKKQLLKSTKLVTVCTGGIRCEKATLFMMENGFSNVVQLEGGILDFLENTNQKNWKGECFVFNNG